MAVAQTVRRRRRAKARRPPPAKIRPGSPAPTMGPGTSAFELNSNVTFGTTVVCPVLNDSPCSSRERSPPTDVQLTAMKNCPRNPTRSRVTVSPPSKVRQGESEVQRPALMRVFTSVNCGSVGLMRTVPDSASPSSMKTVVAFAGTIPKAFGRFVYVQNVDRRQHVAHIDQSARGYFGRIWKGRISVFF